jgi:hypothetical protein
MDPAKHPHPFDVGDRVRSIARTPESEPVDAGVVLEFRGPNREDVRIAFDGKDRAGLWCRPHEYGIETP